MKKAILAACLPILALAVIAGCSKPDAGNGVASVASPTSAGTATNLTYLQQGLLHAQCMRDHGVPEADPRVNPDGGITVGGGYDKHTLDDQVLAQALAACKQFELQYVLTPEDREGKMAGAREFAQCMRDHGVENFPDPDPNDMSKSVPDEVRDDPDYDQAKGICDTPGGAPETGAS